MAVLNAQQRQSVISKFHQAVSAARDPVPGLTKADIAATCNAMDQYLHDNRAAINAAIPEPARTQLTTRQKALIISLVTRARWEEGI